MVAAVEPAEAVRVLPWSITPATRLRKRHVPVPVAASLGHQQLEEAIAIGWVIARCRLGHSTEASGIDQFRPSAHAELAPCAERVGDAVVQCIPAPPLQVGTFGGG